MSEQKLKRPPKKNKAKLAENLRANLLRRKQVKKNQPTTNPGTKQ